MSKVNLLSAKQEIEKWQSVEVGAVFEIGRILAEVKESEIKRGEWTEWLKSVGYNSRTAQRYMQVYKRFNGIEGAETISISKLTELLSLPVDVDVEPYIEAAKNESVRGIREKVREVTGNVRPNTQKRKEQGERRLEEALVRVRMLERQVREIALERDKYKGEVQQAEERAESAERRASDAEARYWQALFNGGASDYSPSKILGLSESASPVEAKRRYRELMRLLHPDHGGDAQLFDVVKKAYDSLYRRRSA